MRHLPPSDEGSGFIKSEQHQDGRSSQSSSSPSRSFIASRLTELDQLEEVFKMRFHGFYGQSEVKLPQQYVENQRLRDTLDDIAYHYGCIENGRVRAAMRVIDWKDIKDESIRRSFSQRYCIEQALKDIGEGHITFCGRLVANSKTRNGHFIIKMMKLAIVDARSRGIRVSYMDCSPALVRMYKIVGFREYTEEFVDPVFGRKMPLIGLPGDLKGLQDIGSPLVDVISRLPDDVEVREWYLTHYGHRQSQSESVSP